MTQKQQIDLLNSIMPEIASTKDPEGVMLKCAKEHNLAPAQLEKLAQVFNTAKTLVGLEKQANRGDAFSIVDVPNLVASYVTYDPSRQISRASQRTHNKVNRLVKDAHDMDGWGACLGHPIQKAASSNEEFFTSPTGLPNLQSLLQSSMGNRGTVEVIDTGNSSEYVAVDPGEASYDVMHKSAATSQQLAGEVRFRNSVEHDLKVARENIEQAAFEASVELREKCASLRARFSPDEGRWKEAVEDVVDIYGSKGAEVIRQAEDYFNDTHLHFEPADLTKRAFTRALVADRHEVFPVIEDMIELNGLLKKAVSFTLTPAEKTIEEQREEDKAQRNSSNSEKYTREEDTSASEEEEEEVVIPEGENDTSAIPVPNGNSSEGERGKRKPKGDPEGAPGFKPVRQGGHYEAPAMVLGDMGIGAISGIESYADGYRNPFIKVDTPIDKPLKTLEGLIDKMKPSVNKNQMVVDSALERAAIEATKQRLMLSDPVIRDADQNTVNDIFETIAGISPSFASDPMKMAPVLKEALQYDSVPLHILRELAVQEGQVLKNEELRHNVESSKYAL